MAAWANIHKYVPSITDLGRFLSFSFCSPNQKRRDLLRKWICIYRTGLTTEVKTHALEFGLKTDEGEDESTLCVQLPN